jgi:thiamine pyrophosphate-dependent acetolactate synthase large subunit-like protein
MNWKNVFILMKSGRPGPVHLDIPIDIAKAMIDPDSLIGYDTTLEKDHYDLDTVKKQVRKFIDDLRNQKDQFL